MKKKYSVFLLLLVISLTIPAFLHAQENKKQKEFSPGWAIGIRLSTFGPGIEIIKSFNPLINLRLGGSYFKLKTEFSVDNDISTINKSYTTFGEINLLADINFLRFMHFTGGLLYNLTKEEMVAKPKEDYYIGDVVLTSETVGSIYYTLTPNKLCPYAGLGFGSSISGSRRVSFAVDLGIVYHGTPKVQLDANGMVSPTASEEQQHMLQDNVKGYRFYPVLNFQLSFRFL
jgi:hypothetical protein